jgi:DNA mismatch repair protein MutH
MTLPYDIKDANSIEQYAKKIIGKALKDVMISKQGEFILHEGKNKGEMGQLLEHYYFGIDNNNRKEPDFPDAGLELKSTPVVYNKAKKLRSKERLVLNIIDFNAEHSLEFEKSGFWKKNKLLLIMFYLHEKDRDLIELVFKLAGIWNFPKEDLRIIQQDWQKIIYKIKAGKAHEISEGDTLYLAACRKGSGYEALRSQPFSSIGAPQRAYSFKQKYVNTIIDQWTSSTIDVEPLIKDVKELDGRSTFEELVISKFYNFLGMTPEEIDFRIGSHLNQNAKNFFATLTLRMLGVKKNKVEEFEKADIVVRTIRIKNNNLPKEDISFPYFKYKEIITENWDTSTLKSLLEKRFFFVIYKFDVVGKLRLEKVMFWTMPYKDLEGEVKKVWEKTIAQIISGDSENLPKKSESKICHVRPHGINKYDLDETPDGQFLIKKCFWLNSQYIKEQILNS